jgi:hypothetical protein
LQRRPSRNGDTHLSLVHLWSKYICAKSNFHYFGSVFFLQNTWIFVFTIIPFFCTTYSLSSSFNILETKKQTYWIIFFMFFNIYWSLMFQWSSVFLFLCLWSLFYDNRFNSLIQTETRVNRISTQDKMDGILFSSVLVKLALLEHPNSKF